MKSRIPILENVSVHYTLHGVRAKSIHLNKELAEAYIVRLKLSDAIIHECFRFEEHEMDTEPQMKELPKT